MMELMILTFRHNITSPVKAYHNFWGGWVGCSGGGGTKVYHNAHAQTGFQDTSGIIVVRSWTNIWLCA